MASSRILCCVFAVSALALGPLAAQDSGGIEGTISRQDGSGIGGASVILNETGDSATSARNGSFRFAGLAPGTYSFSFTLGQNSETREGIEVGSGATTTADVTVDWDVSFLETITVFSASRREERIVDAPASISAFTEEEIQADAVTGQVAKVIEFAPGVEVTQSGIYDYNLNARGFNSSLNRRVQTLIDGREPSVPFLGATDWLSLTSLEGVKSMELVRGPSSALYGANAFNGVLNIVTKSARESRGGRVTLSGGELGTLKGDLSWAGGNDRSNVRVLADYTEGDDFYVPRTATTEYPRLPREAVAGTNQYDSTTFSLRFDHDLSDSATIAFEGSNFDGNGGTIVTGIGRVQENHLERQWYRANMSTPHFNVLAFHNARKAPDQVALASGGRIFLDSTQSKVEVQGNQVFNDGKVRLVAGASYKEEEIDTANNAGIQTLVFKPVKGDFTALFSQVDFDLSDRVKLVFAARWDDSSLHASRTSPKAALVWGINERNTMRFSYNEAFQVPNYSEFFLDAPTAIVIQGRPFSSFDLSGIESALCTPFGISCGFGSPTRVRALGNADLTVEDITSIEVGYSSIINDKAFLTVDYYSNELNNFITDLTANPFGTVNPNFGPYTPPAGYPIPATLLAVLQGQLGLIYPFLSNNVDGTPIFALASYANAGKVDTQGVDVGLNVYATPQWVIDLSYSWFDFTIKDTGGFADSNLEPNAPENKASFGLTYNGERCGGSLKGRWVDGFDWAAGTFVGPVPSYTTASLSGYYDFTDAVTVGINVSNLFDDQHYESFGGDILGRRALGYVRFGW
jgi:outer membrane receptor protein involved in Fe transport